MKPVKVNAEIITLTAGITIITNDSIAVQIVGWDIAGNGYPMLYRLITNKNNNLWVDLHKLLERFHISNVNGTLHNVDATCVDMLGHYTRDAVWFCNKLKHRGKVYAYALMDGVDRPTWPLAPSISRPSRNRYYVGGGADAYTQLTGRALEWSGGLTHFLADVSFRRNSGLDGAYHDAIKNLRLREISDDNQYWMHTDSPPVKTYALAYAARESIRTPPSREQMAWAKEYHKKNKKLFRKVEKIDRDEVVRDLHARVDRLELRLDRADET